jgi:hypothetical protein
MKTLKNECDTASQFDPLKLRLNVWKDYKSGKYKIKASECEIAKVISITPPYIDPPLEDWGRIFQWLGPAKTGKWIIYWLGAETKREFPRIGQSLDSRHLNGGYTIPCSTNGIFIYRIEEATRVLIHELLHAACLDPPGASISVREATVETWTELFLIAHRSAGNINVAEKLWNIQSQWISDTNYKALKEHNVKGENDYGWRYLNGRAHIFESLGAELPKPKPLPAKSSSRFTHPSLD